MTPLCWLAGLGVLILAVVAAKLLTRWSRKRHVEKALPILNQLVSEGEFRRVLDMLEGDPVLVKRYRLDPNQQRQLIDLEVEALEAVGKISEATVQLAVYLRAVYEPGKWPRDLLSRWISLYRSCQPIKVEDFYFCPICGLHPDTVRLLEYAIEQDCLPPTGYVGARRPGVVIHFGGRKKAK